MLRNYSNSRTLGDNIKLGTLTAFTAGTINIASLLIFLSFTSNVTGHYAILAAEISKGNWTQVAVVGGWIFLFFSEVFYLISSSSILIKEQIFCTCHAYCTGDYLSFVCRSLRAVLLSENVRRNRISRCINVICNRSSERFNRKYFKLFS